MALADAATHAFLRMHGALYERSDGRIGHHMAGVPTLLLRTTGARSGQPRCNALVYASDGDDYVVVASNGGQDRSPGWYFNARAKPAVEIQIGREHRPGTARVVESGDPDYERLWRLTNDNNKARYDAYQAQTSRSIPLVVLTPA